MNRCLSIVFAALIMAAGSVSVLGQGAATTEKLATGTYIVYAISPQAWRFTVDSRTMANAAVAGHFSITEGNPKNIEVMVFNEDNFFKWRGDDAAAKAAAKPIFTTGRKTEGDVSVKLPDAGNYYLVLSNSFAYEGTKTLNADFKLTFDKK